jgi:hypothetical protein
MIELAVRVPSPGRMFKAALDAIVPAKNVPAPAGGITAERIGDALPRTLLVKVASPGLLFKAEMATMLPANIVPAPGTGITEERMVFELARMLLIVRSEAALLIWSFLDPLRPTLFLLPLMAVAIKAATAKHATTILTGVDRVMMKIRDAETIEWNFVTLYTTVRSVGSDYDLLIPYGTLHMRSRYAENVLLACDLLDGKSCNIFIFE